ncbi:MAG: 4-hydroxy-tetrahydrodipicolinate reductase [Omnitrophica bacterium RIFCSPLOWO2_12_FULL_44_17]|uniref:4-hydroxy-tetrahydrodipicolinate reductase n=1 Tax=Candidatus Danuiimicrobium aquiferis TaxID=1801832 RepID=A0A1G1L1K7_9BACT|nr:MAG: 4-hydroxy-tetrahydrodipicolinate reductase [Omnitrophica bacterium RIFCSPHIGHO2_02_FULL_45_28]OGW90414.1 MAG: 4-hydroxy-tetrahydrodipicolinate reductase [Omnitrophica bacterium RIFCSPHIGHO2_12_FULL_44_12]OGW99040.1 MAG: 4-hydroxy-tetrahydrodipicolinate reductase [Omnitrophica bacterium RIFCSPLOWO2_12_FULL_44_17]OGX04116.1 MAG: 4-hydroxy-tetrahydrodipicolinate reductase [Omnitrophica bacterium RIFCSPLOWO2_02_FULL_44_11]
MEKQRIKIVVAGAAGRMGKAILDLAHRDREIEIAGAFEKADHPMTGKTVGVLIGVDSIQVPIDSDIAKTIAKGDVVIDFTHSDVTPKIFETVLSMRKAVVIGTTGLQQKFIEQLSLASKTIPIVQAPNMSIGVNLLFRLASMVGEVLDDRYDVEIVEEHHRHKKDAPSGTALELARLIAKARKINLDEKAIYGRHGMTGERSQGTIGVHAVRGGDTVGYHQVCFLTEGERVELVHRATSRNAFAAGALKAAKFLADKKSGFFNMQQVLGL